MNRNIQRNVIPAPSGFFRLERYAGETFKEPIVAWLVVSEVETDDAFSVWACPVIPGNTIHSDSELWILQPDGSVEVPQDRTFPDEQSWAEYMDEREQAKKSSAGPVAAPSGDAPSHGKE